VIGLGAMGAALARAQLKAGHGEEDIAALIKVLRSGKGA
jgi:hypothetical protein